MATTTFILLECGNTAARRAYRDNINTCDEPLEMRGELIVPTQEDWLNAWETFEREEAGQSRDR